VELEIAEKSLNVKNIEKLKEKASQDLWQRWLKKCVKERLIVC